jgi:formylglycine-generating enzyme required for sulfatase activity
MDAVCGPNPGGDCCEAILVTAGDEFYRGFDTNHPATVSDFRLDKYEVTVGRFRNFVQAMVDGWQPSAGSGKHAHLNGGDGLADRRGLNRRADFRRRAVCLRQHRI